MRGLVGEAFEAQRARAAEAGQVDARDAALRRERRRHAVEDGELREERMDQQQVGAVPLLLDLDLEIGKLEKQGPP